MHEQSQDSTKTLIEYAPTYAHLVRLRADAQGKPKIPIKAAWQDYPALRAQVDTNAVGIIPESIDSICIDVDEGGDAMRERVESELGAPWLLVQSSPGRWHMWYRVTKADTPRAFTMRKVGSLLEFRYSRCQMRIVGWRKFWLAWQVQGAKATPIRWPVILDLYETIAGEQANDGRIANDWQEGTRDTTLYRESQKAAGDATRLAALAQDARQAGLPEAQIESTQASAAKSQVAQTLRSKTLVTRDWKGLAQALESLGLDLRFNLRWGRMEYKNVASSGEWRAQTGRYDAWVRQQITAHCLSSTAKGEQVPTVWGRETYALLRDTLATEREIDPFRYWLESLPDWDGKERMRTLVERVFSIKAEQAELVRWVSTFLLCGTVERTMRPGSKLDETPVLVGAQSLGKSTFIELLLPPELEGLFSGGIDLRGDDKQRAEALQGRAIVEASELQGARRADLNALKAFLSRTDDGIARMAYAHGTETMRRRCILVGTSNEASCLPNDTSGNRRFVVVEVGRKRGVGIAKMREIVNRERVQLWAEALNWWATCRRDGNPPSARLPDELAQAQAQVNEGFRSSNQCLEDKILDALQGIKGESFGIGELMSRAEIPTAQDKAVGGILRSLGYDKTTKRVKGVLRKVWLRKDSK